MTLCPASKAMRILFHSFLHLTQPYCPLAAEVPLASSLSEPMTGTEISFNLHHRSVCGRGGGGGEGGVWEGGRIKRD